MNIRPYIDVLKSYKSDVTSFLVDWFTFLFIFAFFIVIVAALAVGLYHFLHHLIDTKEYDQAALGLIVFLLTSSFVAALLVRKS